MSLVPFAKVPFYRFLSHSPTDLRSKPGLQDAGIASDLVREGDGQKGPVADVALAGNSIRSAMISKIIQTTIQSPIEELDAQNSSKCTRDVSWRLSLDKYPCPMIKLLQCFSNHLHSTIFQLATSKTLNQIKPFTLDQKDHLTREPHYLDHLL